MTNDKVRLQEDELIKYDFAAKPSSAELVPEKDDDEGENSEDDIVLKKSKKPVSTKRRKLVRATSAW